MLACASKSLSQSCFVATVNPTSHREEAPASAEVKGPPGAAAAKKNGQ